MIYFEDARLEFFGQPVAYMPYFSAPDPTVKRKTGFLMPWMTSSSTNGFGVEIPYYWALAPDYDFTFSPRLMTQQGALLRGEFRQRCSSRTTSTTSSRPPTGSPCCGSDGTSDVFDRRNDDAAGCRRGDHRRRAHEGLGDPVRRGRGSGHVSSADVVGADKAPPPPLEDEQLPGGFRGARERMWLNVRTGNLGPIPIIVGEIVVVIFFGLHRDELLHVRQLRQPDHGRRRARRCSPTASSSCSCSARSTSRSATSPASVR